MNETVKIIADSTCDLSPELIERYHIRIVPLHIIMDDVSYDDGFNMTPEKIYEWSNRTRSTPKTSAPNQEEIEKVLKEEAGAHDEIICFTISSEMSSTAQVFHLVAEELGLEDRVFVIDSRSLSTGNGLLVIKAAEMAIAGSDGRTITAEITKLIPRVRASFVVDTLTFLYRGGRCSAVAAMAGSALKFHPIIKVTDGKMLPGKKLRGDIDKCFELYIHSLREEMASADDSRVFITHSGMDDATIEQRRISYTSERQ